MNTDLPVLTRDQTRELDHRAIREFGVPGTVLMENAGRGVADRLCQLGIAGSVAVFCGKGNNAGDGFVIARHLDSRGHDVRVFVATDEADYGGDAKLNFQIAKRSGIRFNDVRQALGDSQLKSVLQETDWVLDAILGIGATGNPRAPWDNVIPQLNAAPSRRLAVDIPTGLDCDSGEVGFPTFQAHYTCTFVAKKPGLLVPHAQVYVGDVSIVDIGAPRILVDEITGTETADGSNS